MSRFTITATRPETPSEDDDLRRIRMAAGDDVLTRLVRNVCEHDQALHAPVTPLAYWLIDNWWRILFEPVPATGPDYSWHLAHELSSIGGGYMWPCVAFWGEGGRIGMHVHQEPLPTPIQFLTEGIRYVPTPDVESGVDRFIRQLLTDGIEDCIALRAAYDALCADREDEDARDWRAVEAMLGYDINEAPDGLMGTLADLVDRYGQTGIEEAVLAKPGEQAANTLQAAVAAASASNICARLPEAIERMSFDRNQPVGPWALAEQAAASLRAELCVTSPIGDQALGDILGVSCSALDSGVASDVPYGLRVADGHGEHSRLALKSTRPQGRRFELCRHLGDMVWCGTGTLGPVSDALSVRQKFQRAFAQNFLCPYSELLAYCGATPALDDLVAAASHFRVSEHAVDAILDHNGHVTADSFVERVNSA